MIQQLDIVTLVVGSVLALWLVATVIINRPKTPEHDIRRRALQIIGGVALALVSVSAAASPVVTVTKVLTGAAVVIVGLYLVLRPPPELRPPHP